MSTEAIVWTVMGVYAVGAVVAGVIYQMGADYRSPIEPDYSIMVWLFWPIIAVVLGFGTIVFLATLATQRLARRLRKERA